MEKSADGGIGKTTKQNNKTNHQYSTGYARTGSSSLTQGYAPFMSNGGHDSSFSCLSRTFAVFYLGTSLRDGQREWDKKRGGG